MSKEEGEGSHLFQDEEAMQLRRRPVQRTQMGEPRPRASGEKRKPIVEWAKAILISFGLVACFLTFVWQQRTRHFQRKEADFVKLDKCDLRSYPLWQIEELKELNLSECKFIDLPVDRELWGRFKSLKKLDLNSNFLRDLPTEMSVLTSLEILFLSENKFDTIPQVIGELESLRLLSLRGNLLTDLFATHLPAQSLEWLILTNNRINNVHPIIGELTLLRKLMLSHNRIETIPVELGECKNLELLRLADNKLKTVPNEVLTLPKLAWISLSGNPMSMPPKSIEKVIKESDITMDKSKILGKGASGTVYQGKYNGKNVAVKIFKDQSRGSDGNAADEAAINGLINHQFAMSAVGVIPFEGKEDTYKGMVMDLIKGTYPLGKVPSFDTVTRDEGPALHSENLKREQVLSVVFNIVSALEYIHSIGVSHSDVYLHNVLRDGKYVARLSDWGASFIYDHENTEAAAVFERIEVLAFGRLLQNLFDWHLNIELPDKTEQASDNERQNIGKLDEGPFKELVASILQNNQAKRPNFRMVKQKLESIDEFKKFVKQ
eukprot:CAMPEP_0183718650 /NCGR_PEP_ID=MMETSP0737-20130205/11854_1 /TAXON_ID=385413 /ORGANISM="Thalassiosira miniscula, Strain CCMP1093" /LENGTH=547 /DNA_ID=CAMNT_0025948247 /DNA_START=260 /DNA_END=1903 /DNA_ORIENTATION=+